jgi:hypothetical protein
LNDTPKIVHRSTQEVILNIAITDKNERILYDIVPTNKEKRNQVGSARRSVYVASNVSLSKEKGKPKKAKSQGGRNKKTKKTKFS